MNTNEYHVEVTGWNVENESAVDDGRGPTEDAAVADAKRRGGIVEVGDVTILAQPSAFYDARCSRQGCAHQGSCGYGAP